MARKNCFESKRICTQQGRSVKQVDNLKRKNKREKKRDQQQWNCVEESEK